MVPVYKKNYLVSFIRPNPDLYGNIYLLVNVLSFNYTNILVHVYHLIKHDFRTFSVELLNVQIGFYLLVD